MKHQKIGHGKINRGQAPSAGHRGAGARIGQGAMGSMRGFKPFTSPRNDGNLFTTKSKVRKRDFHGNGRGGARPSGCFITTACVRSRGLADDCYELQLLRMFRENYVAARLDGEEVLAEYRRKAPAIVEAIDALDPPVALKTWDYVYEDGIAPACCLILSGHWDAAFDLYREVCRVLEEHFLEGLEDLEGLDADGETDGGVSASGGDSIPNDVRKRQTTQIAQIAQRSVR